VQVGARYTILARNRVSFELARYDPKRELRIDPVVLVYSTYLGGSNVDEGNGIAVDEAAQPTSRIDRFEQFPTQSAYRRHSRDEEECSPSSSLSPTLS